MVYEHVTTLTWSLLSCGTSPGWKTSLCVTRLPECRSGSWWRHRWTLQASLIRKMWSRLWGNHTAARGFFKKKPLMDIISFCSSCHIQLECQCSIPGCFSCIAFIYRDHCWNCITMSLSANIYWLDSFCFFFTTWSLKTVVPRWVVTNRAQHKQ